MTGIRYYSQIDLKAPPTEPNHVIRLADMESYIEQNGGGFSGVGFPSEESFLGELVAIALPSSPTYYTAPENGIITFYVGKTTSVVSMSLTCMEVKSRTSSIINVPVNSYPGIFLIVGKGEEVRISWTGSFDSYIYATFTPIKSSAYKKGIRYSLEEQETGDYWIDGRPIYQKTFIVTSPSTINSMAAALNVADTSDLNIEKMIDINGMYRASNVDIPFGYTHLSTCSIQCYFKNPYICIQASGSGNPDHTNCPGHVTIKYTKTTDAPEPLNFTAVSNIHAIQQYDDQGEMEFEDYRPNSKLTEDGYTAEVEPYVDAWEVEVAEESIILEEFQQDD